jgi:hypothetical protein
MSLSSTWKPQRTIVPRIATRTTAAGAATPRAEIAATGEDPADPAPPVVPQITCFGQRPCCEFDDITGKCRIFAVCFGGGWVHP